MAKYIIETVSLFKLKYAVEADSMDKAIGAVEHHVEHGDLIEFSQKHIAENIFDCREILDEEFLTLWDQDNDYMIEWKWSDAKKLSFINKI